jgi:hypothetical protein
MKIKFGERIKFSNPNNFKMDGFDEIGKEIAFKGSYNFWVEPVEAFDNAVTEAIIKIAKERGIDEVVLLNKPAIISAIEKQIPKKPSETDKARCIHCACVVKRSEKFCKNCGQALDWGDGE